MKDKRLPLGQQYVSILRILAYATMWWLGLILQGLEDRLETVVSSLEMADFVQCYGRKLGCCLECLSLHCDVIRRQRVGDSCHGKSGSSGPRKSEMSDLCESGDRA